VRRRLLDLPPAARPRARGVSAALMALTLACCCAPEGGQARPASSASPSTSSAGAAPRSPGEVRKAGNHLVGQPSLYLEQHGHNPVDWYPWGEEALSLARSLGRPLFISIGYATCHWCHVMEHECFEDDQVAALLNERFVAVKVDREQRPDVDALYMDAVSALGGSTGWPLTVIATPDGAPYFGGTYFPKESRQGQPGLLEILRETDRLWREEGPRVAARGKEILAHVAAPPGAAGVAGAGPALDTALLREAMERLAQSRDDEQGGFGGRQKFPNAPLLLAELRFARRTGDARAREHLVLTLEKMARGGIRDPLAGSFHRYTVDRTWHVPHFEKTLYDNAQLAALYVEAGLWLGRADLVAVGRGVLDDLLRAWQRPDGGLVVGFDADDAGGEGAFYTWTPAELGQALGGAMRGESAEAARLAARFGEAFGVTAAGERSLGGRSVLHRQEPARSPAGGAGAAGASTDALEQDIARALPLLAAARSRRPPPAVDDKELCGWNGLALVALADAGRWLEEARYVAGARRVGKFLVETCWDPSAGLMRRGVRAGAPLGQGFLEDHALAGLGLLRLHAADGDLAWLERAKTLADVLSARFRDQGHGGFSRSIGGAPLVGAAPARQADDQDGPSPSGGSAAALLLLEVGALSGDASLGAAGLEALAAAAQQARSRPFSSGFWLVAIDHASGDPREVVVAGAPGDEATRALVREVAPTTFARVLPARIGPDGAGPLEARFPALAGKSAQGGRPTAYVCRRGACEAPTHEPAALREQLRAASR
jgi:uncharacterized protein